MNETRIEIVDGMSYLLVDVVVSSKFQGRGIGKKLVNAIIEEVKDNTIIGEYSTINMISIKDTERFYEGCGFEAVPFGYNGKGMRIKIEKKLYKFHLVRICIIPEYQNRGIGTDILKDVLSDNSDKEITIQYFKQNPVGRLYQRLGFEFIGETQFHYQMIKEI